MHFERPLRIAGLPQEEKRASRCPTSCSVSATTRLARLLTFPAINLSAASARNGYFTQRFANIAPFN